MNELQKKVLTEAVEHWKKNVESYEEDSTFFYGSGSCACCKMRMEAEKVRDRDSNSPSQPFVCHQYKENDKYPSCPIAEHVGRKYDYCDGTPYNFAVDYCRPEVMYVWLKMLLEGKDPPAFDDDVYWREWYADGFNT